MSYRKTINAVSRVSRISLLNRFTSRRYIYRWCVDALDFGNRVSCDYIVRGQKQTHTHTHRASPTRYGQSDKVLQTRLRPFIGPWWSVRVDKRVIFRAVCSHHPGIYHNMQIYYRQWICDRWCLLGAMQFIVVFRADCIYTNKARRPATEKGVDGCRLYFGINMQAICIR